MQASPEFGLLFLFIPIVLYLALVIIALVSIMKNDFKGGANEKWMWLVLIIVLPFIGSIVYLFTGGQRKIRS